MDKFTGIPLSKKYNFMSVRFSCKSSQRFSERNRFPDLPHLTFDVRTTLGFRPGLGVFIKTFTKLAIYHSHKILASTGRNKKIVFRVTVVFIDKLYRTRQIWQDENEQYLPRDDHVTQR